MQIDQAIQVARRWLDAQGRALPGFVGAYLVGSGAERSGADELPASSDLDVMVVLRGDVGLKPGKIRVEGVLLEISLLGLEAIVPFERALSDYHIAHGLNLGRILSDPDGVLGEAHAFIAPRFRALRWIGRRMDQVDEKIRRGIEGMDEEAALEDLLNSWLFPTGITAHRVLVAALQNPTVRLRYMAAREVLRQWGYDAFYEQMLELLGCARLDAGQVARGLDVMARAFDAAAALEDHSFFFSSDIASEARPLAVDGSLALIESGDHREAVFWILATYARCLKILRAGRSEALPEFEACLWELLAPLGLFKRWDFVRAGRRTLQFLPGLGGVCEGIARRNAIDGGVV